LDERTECRGLLDSRDAPGGSDCLAVPGPVSELPDPFYLMSELHQPIRISGLLLALALVWPGEAHAQPDLDTANQRVAEGMAALQAGTLEKADRSFREALAIAPDLEPALLGLSKVLERQGDIPAALVMARQAVEAAPQSAPATLAVARHLARLGETSQALDTLETFRKLDPSEPRGYLFSALLLRDQGLRQEAIAMLELALDRDLREPQLETELAMLLIAADRLQEARQRIENGLETHGDTGGFQLALGMATARDASLDRSAAIPHLERALELGVPEPSKVQLELGSLLLEANRAAEAVEQLSRAAALMPNSSDVYYKLGVAQRATGDAEGARESLTRFQEFKAREEERERLDLQVGTALNEAQSLASADRLGEALAAIDELLAGHPEEARGHTLRAKILYSMGQPDSALAAVSRARQLDPAQIEPNFLEGMFLLQMNRPAEARAALLRAVSLDPSLGEGHALLGGAAAKLNDPEEAVTHFAQALELGADSPSLRLGYAAALESLGRLEESAEQDAAYRRLVQRPQ
jgi:tetratricopeptide (TPR) repeat protein